MNVSFLFYYCLAGIDLGGVRREYFTKLSEEIFEKLKLFIPSPNSISNLGNERDKWVPNPSINLDTALHNYYKLGVAMACCSKVREVLDLSMPSIFWKFMLSKIFLYLSKFI